MPKYKDLQELFSAEPQAHQYFNNLPDHIKRQVQRAGGICCFDGLRSFAENLMNWPE